MTFTSEDKVPHCVKWLQEKVEQKKNVIRSYFMISSPHVPSKSNSRSNRDPYFGKEGTGTLI
jgi:hypothetical protein